MKGKLALLMAMAFCIGFAVYADEGCAPCGSAGKKDKVAEESSSAKSDDASKPCEKGDKKDAEGKTVCEKCTCPADKCTCEEKKDSGCGKKSECKDEAKE